MRLLDRLFPARPVTAEPVDALPPALSRRLPRKRPSRAGRGGIAPWQKVGIGKPRPH